MRRISYKEVVRDVKGVREEEENRWMVHKSEHDQRRKRNVNYFLLAFTTTFVYLLHKTTTKIRIDHNKIRINSITYKLVKKFCSFYIASFYLLKYAVTLGALRQT